MSALAWSVCVSLIAASWLTAAWRGRRGVREGRGALAAHRLKSPTLSLFVAYLLVAGLVSPVSEGESASPLIGLALVIPIAYAAATYSAIGSAAPRPLTAAALGVLHAAAVAAAAAIVIALLSPAFVMTWLK